MQWIPRIYELEPDTLLMKIRGGAVLWDAQGFLVCRGSPDMPGLLEAWRPAHMEMRDAIKQKGTHNRSLKLGFHYFLISISFLNPQVVPLVV